MVENGLDAFNYSVNNMKIRKEIYCYENYFY